MQTLRWHPFPAQDALQAAVLDAIRRGAEQAIASRGAFHLVLAGGNTPRAVYGQCRKFVTDWTRWHVYFGDERCLPEHDPARNSTMASEAWLAHVPIPPSQIHAIPAEIGAEEAAVAYAETLHPLGDFDLVLLGLGEDGHTASLFPGHPWGDAQDAPDTLAVRDAPKPPPARVSLSARRLSRTREVVFIVAGAEKKDALSAWQTKAGIPAQSILPVGGIDVFCEAGLLAPTPKG